MEKLFTILLVLHIAGGLTGLIAGSINLIMKKGGQLHRKIGKIFVAAMITAGFSALGLSVIHPNYFLFMVGIFTIYMVGTGNRYVYFRLIGKDQKPKFLDWLLTVSMALSGILLLGIGIWILSGSNYFGIVFIVFGLFGLRFVTEDVKNYKGKSRFKNFWLVSHISRMTGGYIASVTAFLVVNAKYLPIQLPSVLIWLLPSLILVPFIIKWSRKMAVKKVIPSK